MCFFLKRKDLVFKLDALKSSTVFSFTFVTVAFVASENVNACR